MQHHVDRDYIWDQSLLNYLVAKLSYDDSDLLPNTNEVNVRNNICDLILEGDFPEELIPKLRNPSTQLFMMPQGRCPPWVHKVAPLVLELLQLNSVNANL